MNHLNWMLTMATTIGLLVRKYVRWIMSGRLFVRMTSVGFCHFIWFAVYSGLEFLFILCHRFAFIHSISLENAMLNTPNQIIQFIFVVVVFFLLLAIGSTYKRNTQNANETNRRSEWRRCERKRNGLFGESKNVSSFHHLSSISDALWREHALSLWWLKWPSRSRPKTEWLSRSNDQHATHAPFCVRARAHTVALSQKQKKTKHAEGTTQYDRTSCQLQISSELN